MLIGYMRVSKADGSQVFDLQHDALVATDVDAARLYQDQASGKTDDRPGLRVHLKSLGEDDTLVLEARPAQAQFATLSTRSMI